jgi:hypothetical protein
MVRQRLATPPGGNFAAIFKPTYPSTARRPWRTSYVQRPDFKFFTLNFTLSRELHPFENRALLERSRAAFARISITRREEPLRWHSVYATSDSCTARQHEQDMLRVLHLRLYYLTKLEMLLEPVGDPSIVADDTNGAIGVR